MQTPMKNQIPTATDSAPAATETASDRSQTSPRTRSYWIRIIGFWICTLIVAWEMVAGSMWDLLKIEYVRVVFDHLGYPHYLLLIIGVWKLPCALMLVVPRFERLKEWAYAGAVFNYTGAAASHLLTGDGPNKWVAPLMFAAMTLVSWAVRPLDRRLPRATSTTSLKPVAWIVPLAVIAAFLVLALLTLPKGPPPPF